MNGRIVRAATMLLALALVGGSASAQPIEIVGEPCPITLYPTAELSMQAAPEKEVGAEPAELVITRSGRMLREPEAEPMEEATEPETEEVPIELSVTALDVLGVYEETAVAVSIDGRYGYVPMEQMKTLLPQALIDSLPVGSATDELRKGSKGDAVKAFQQRMIELGYLSGKADGDYGKGTTGKVTKYQELRGLPATGRADMLTQWVLEEEAEGAPEAITVTYPMPEEDPLQALSERCGRDLASLSEAGWTLIADRFTDSGYLTNGASLARTQITAPAIDRVCAALELRVRMIGKRDGTAELTPVLTLSSKGAFRPYLTKVYVETASGIQELSILKRESGVESMDVWETATIELTEALIAELSEEGASLTLYAQGSGCTLEAQPDAAMIAEVLSVLRAD